MAKKFKTRKNTQNKPHLIIDAGPGCGKSTTTVAALGIMAGVKPKWYKSATDEQKAIWDAMDGTYHSIGFQAFNKSIAVELQSKLPPSVDAKTFHSFGYAVLKANGYKTKMTQDNVGYMLKDMLGYGKDERMSKEHWDLLVVVKKVVSLLKNNLFDATKENVLHVVKYNNIEVNGNIDQIVKFAKQVFDKTLKIEKGKFQWIDFDDMIWLPIALNMDFTSVAYDLLVCDESQDLNPVQHELIVRSGVRLVCVGDPRQAIYGFRGADSKSMTTLEELLGKTKRGVEVLPLQVSFRLPNLLLPTSTLLPLISKRCPMRLRGRFLTSTWTKLNPRRVT
jgi:superfamily I DNA/RNA helicase